jgi:hypothetical protein
MIVAGGGRTGTLHVCNGSAGAARWPPSPGLAPGQKIPWPRGPLRVDGAARLPKPRFRLSGSAARLGRGVACSGAERLTVGGGGAPRLQRQRRWGELAAVSRARARKEAAPPRNWGRGRPGSGAERWPGARGGASVSPNRVSWGELHPAWGAQQPYTGVILPSMVVTLPSTGNPAWRKVSAAPAPARTRQRTPHHPHPIAQLAASGSEPPQPGTNRRAPRRRRRISGSNRARRRRPRDGGSVARGTPVPRRRQRSCAPISVELNRGGDRPPVRPA